MLVHTSEVSILEAETGGWRVPGQPGLHSKNLSQSKTKQIKKKQFFNEKFNS
jgi:hypothetical protein